MGPYAYIQICKTHRKRLLCIIKQWNSFLYLSKIVLWFVERGCRLSLLDATVHCVVYSNLKPPPHVTLGEAKTLSCGSSDSTSINRSHPLVRLSTAPSSEGGLRGKLVSWYAYSAGMPIPAYHRTISKVDRPSDRGLQRFMRKGGATTTAPPLSALCFVRNTEDVLVFTNGFAQMQSNLSFCYLQKSRTIIVCGICSNISIYNCGIYGWLLG